MLGLLPYLVIKIEYKKRMIPQDYSEHIDNFHQLLLAKLEQIAVLESKEKSLFKKILYVSFIDSLAACVYPGRPNKYRFLAAIERFSRWDDRSRVSIPHLGKYGSITSDPELQELRKRVKPVLERWIHRKGEQIPISEDFPKDVVRSLWKPAKDTDIAISVSDFTHANMLYQLRNALVHQFQSRDNELMDDRRAGAYYQVVTELGGGPIKFELVYTTKLLENISREMLVNTTEYFKEGNINPFPHYFAGEYWLPELNL